MTNDSSSVSASPLLKVFHPHLIHLRCPAYGLQ